jgi:hypothetical protein
VNILQIYPKGDYFTGAAIQLRDLAAGLAGRGHHVVVATRPNVNWERACGRWPASSASTGSTWSTARRAAPAPWRSWPASW